MTRPPLPIVKVGISSTSVASPALADSEHIQEVIRCAQAELTELFRQRAETMKRIGTLKQTLIYLAKVFGDDLLSPEVLRLLGRSPARKQSGLTHACRAVLMEATSPIDARQGLQELRRKFPTLIEHHKNQLASVTTIFNRLAGSAEARVHSNGNGRRLWEWISEPGHGADALLAGSIEDLEDAAGASSTRDSVEQ